MVTVEFLGPIGLEPMELEVKNFYELKDELSKIVALKDWLKSCAVAVNDELVSSLDEALKGGDRVSLLPPVCGG